MIPNYLRTNVLLLTYTAVGLRLGTVARESLSVIRGQRAGDYACKP